VRTWQNKLELLNWKAPSEMLLSTNPRTGTLPGQRVGFLLTGSKMMHRTSGPGKITTNLDGLAQPVNFYVLHFDSICRMGLTTEWLAINQAMMAAVKADATSTRGQRNVLDGELELLEGFEFNIAGELTSAIYFPYTATIDRVTGALAVAIPGFSPLVWWLHRKEQRFSV
jgi:hypothetical protein